MKTILLAGLAGVLAVGLTGCETMNAAGNAGHAVVGTGVSAGKTVVHGVGTGVNAVGTAVTSPFHSGKSYNKNYKKHQ